MTEHAVGLPNRGVKRAWLFNPFQFVAGGQAMALGIGVILAAGLICYFSRSHFDGVLDFHTGLQAPLWMHLVEGIVDWLALSVVLLPAGWMVAQSRFRMIDVFGTQALARWPSAGMALFAFLPGYQRETDRLAAAVMVAPAELYKLLAPSVDLAAFLVVIVFMLILTVWMIALMYRAFAVSCNAAGAKAIGVFIAALLVSEVLSKVLLSVLYGVAI